MALELTSPDGSQVYIDYDARLLYGSLGIALLCVYFGLEIARHDKYFGMSKQKRVAILMQYLRRPGVMSGADSKTQIEFKILFDDLGMISLGAVLTR